jgi:predicted phosphodiesterase
MKKFISVLMCLAMLLTTTAAGVFACSQEVNKEYGKLQFNSDGNFKIFQITDMQDGAYMNESVKDFLRASIKKENPDLIILTGDNISGGSCSTGISKKLDTLKCSKGISEFMNIFEKCGVPVVAVFGNHDDEKNKLSKEELMKIYTKYSCFIGYDEGDSLYGCGTYNLPIYASTDSSKIKYNLWMIDSNTYDEELGGYDYVHDDQVQWYVDKANELKAQNGGENVPSMAFQHIIVREIFDTIEYGNSAANNGFNDKNGTHVSIKQEYYKKGELNESPCPSTRSDKEFTAMKQQGDVVAMFFGHDHINSFELNYQGIDLVATPACNLSDYSSHERGVRIININENDTTTYETHMLGWADVYGDNYIATQHYNMYACEIPLSGRIKAGMIYTLLFPIKLIFGYVF